jgi:hypothetical protein
VEVEVRGAKPVWMNVADFWKPENISLFLPPWKAYCKRKVLPLEWRGAEGGYQQEEQGVMEEEARGDEVLTQYSQVALDEGEAEKEEEAEPADCYGHALDDRGVVYMELRWKDDGSMSRATVKSVMGRDYERRTLSGTWLQYCDQIGKTGEMFRIHGVSTIASIKGHEFNDCGRPVVEIEWDHGETSKVMVKDAFERKGDANGFQVAWAAYCDSLGVAADDGMRKGHVDKDRKKVNKKKRKVGYT